MKHLILGGARSGKSQFAEAQAKSLNKPLIYLATGQAHDAEMTARISHHKSRRGDEWQLVEEPTHLADALSKLDDNASILIDCLTLWLSNCLANECLDKQKTLLLEHLAKTNQDLFIVTNEVGSGVVPLGELSRIFVDQSGWLHQELARICEKVTLVVAGLPLSLK